jgi:2-C-methyl-D-erythritol 2,4-cyclodiphosphate synthase
MTIRIGHGFDVHRLAPGRPLVLGGVVVPHDRGLLGHSDADVLAHALCDALLGAAALGDIGAHFPDSDAAYKDADSMRLLTAVVAKIAAAGYVVGNVDATVAAEAPQLAPHIAAMRETIAAALGVAVDTVSVKATTTEKLGAVGRGEGIAATAVALILSR